MGSRTSDNEAAAAWVAEAGAGASQGTFADAAEFGQTVMNCTNGPWRSTRSRLRAPRTWRERC